MSRWRRCLKQNFGDARHGWKMMGGKFAYLLRQDVMSRWIRQVHRWVSIAFTLAVIANFVVMGMTGGQQPPAYITYSPLLPLFLLMFTGLYMFVLPYRRKANG